MLKNLAIITALAVSALYGKEQTPDARLKTSADVFREIMNTPDKGIPTDLLNKAQCIVVVPGLIKGAFLVGGDYGRGFAVCRRHNRAWGAPAAVRFGGGSFGAQIGVKSTDVVMLVMNQGGMEKLASDKFTIGGDASAAAGPVGRTVSAETDALLHAEILTWSRSRGAFAGVSLKGTVVSKDDSEDQKLYGHEVSNHAILAGDVAVPRAARVLISELDRYSPAKTRKS